MNRRQFAEAISKSPRVCDGAMGTVLYAKGVMVNKCYDELNLSQPELVRAIHEEYVSVGVDVIETNTYGANRLKLASHGLGAQVERINERGVELAREVVRSSGRDSVWVAGAIGPLGKTVAPIGTVHEDDARDIFREQASGLLAGGADLILLETFSDLKSLKLALESVRDLADEVPVVAQMTFGEDGLTPLGASPERVARELMELDVDMVGANCSLGPEMMYRVLERMRRVCSLPLSVQPNAGLPEVVDGRVIYLCSPEYMAHYAKRFFGLGTRLLGGCCGTTAAHIGAIVGVVRALGPARERVEIAEPQEPRPAREPVPREQKSRLARALGRKFVVSVEMDPPRGAEPGSFVEKAQWLKENEVDFINVADGPRASARMSALSFALLLEQHVGIEAILHYQCRDRNLIGIQADLLGAQALGLRNILAVTGDPPKLGDYPHATPVFDVDSIGLVRILARMNVGQDLAANALGPALPFHIGVAANPGARDLDAEVEKFRKKVDAGAEFCMTQPVYDPRYLERFLEAVKDCRLPTLVGILPLVSSRNAEFLHNEVPGMSVPDDVRRRLADAPDKASAQGVGVDVARESLRAARDIAEGAYLMPPFNKFELAVRVIEGLI